MERLSDLEQTVLGIVWRDGPCTRYHIRSEFTRVPSSHWSGSAGSIYPLVDRLEARELMRSEAADRGRRPGRALTITDAGRRALKGWVSAPLPEDAVVVHFDALRTRAFFLGLLTPAQRERFLEDAEQKLKTGLAEAEAHCAELRDEDELAYLAARGAVYVTRARIAWVREMRRELG